MASTSAPSNSSTTASSKQRDAGCAVLLVSAELDEILSLSDRVAVMYKGEILDILPIEEATRERVGLLMAGVKEQR